VQRQQLFVRAAVVQAIRQGARNPVQLRLLFDSVKDDIILDDTLTVGRLFGVGDQLRGASSETLAFFTLPTVDGWAGAAAVLYLLPDAPAVVAAFNDTTPRLVPVAPDGSGVRDPFSDYPATTVPEPPAGEPDTSPFVPRVPSTETCI
jgi:hypothetical protein